MSRREPWSGGSCSDNHQQHTSNQVQVEAEPVVRRDWRIDVPVELRHPVSRYTISKLLMPTIAIQAVAAPSGNRPWLSKPTPISPSTAVTRPSRHSIQVRTEFPNELLRRKAHGNNAASTARAATLVARRLCDSLTEPPTPRRLASLPDGAMSDRRAVGS